MTLEISSKKAATIGYCTGSNMCKKVYESPVTYKGAHGMAAEKLLVSKNVFESINDLTRRGRC